MRKIMKYCVMLAVVFGVMAVAASEKASAQSPVAVTTYSPVQPVVTYYPERRGLFGRRIVFRPVVTYAVPATSVPVTTYYAPAAPVTTYYAPAPRITPAPVTTYYAPAPATTYYYAPVIGF